MANIKFAIQSKPSICLHESQSVKMLYEKLSRAGDKSLCVVQHLHSTYMQQ